MTEQTEITEGTEDYKRFFCLFLFLPLFPSVPSSLFQLAGYTEFEDSVTAHPHKDDHDSIPSRRAVRTGDFHFPGGAFAAALRNFSQGTSVSPGESAHQLQHPATG
jgi:hypothetical protein